jgi:hypothetical protein
VAVTIVEAAPLSVRRAHEAGQMMLTIDNAGVLEILALTNDWSDLQPGAPTAICRCCGKILPLDCFDVEKRGMTSYRKRRHAPDCCICDAIKRRAKRMATIWLDKARNALRAHYYKERDEGLHNCAAFDEYLAFTGITITWLAERMHTAWEANESCEHCESIGHESHWQYICPVDDDGIPELVRMTVDRTDPQRCLSRSNLQLLCNYGNTAKHRSSPEIYDLRNRYWRRYNLEKRDASRPPRP